MVIHFNTHTDCCNDSFTLQHHWTPPNTVQENIMPHIAAAETPLVTHLGKYDMEQKKFKQERHKDFHAFTEKVHRCGWQELTTLAEWIVWFCYCMAKNRETPK